MFRAFLIPALIIAAATSLVYSNSLHGTFVFDDLTSIPQDQAVQNHDWRALWTIHATRFIPYATFALQTMYAGNDVVPFHVFNMLLHMATAIMVYLFSLLLLHKKPHRNLLALSVALLFAVHPIQTQAVTYIVQRIALFAAFGYITTLNFYIYGRISNKTWPIIAAFLCALATMFTKETAVTLPLSIIALEILVFKLSIQDVKKHLLRLLLFSLTIFIIPFTLWATRGIVTSEPVVATIHLPGLSAMPSSQPKALARKEYFLTEITVIPQYIQLLIAPYNQTIDHDVPTQRSQFSPRVMASELLLLMILVLAWRIRKLQPVISFGIFFFFIALSLESTIFPIEDVMFEHRLYLPCVGLFLAFIDFVQSLRITKKQPVAIATCICIAISIFGYISFERNAIWDNAISLWQDAAQKAPHKIRPHYNLAAAYALAGDNTKAQRIAQETLVLNPHYALANTLLGTIAYQQHDLATAATYLRSATHDQPELVDPHIILSTILGEEGKFDESIIESTTALALQPTSLAAQVNLASAYIGKKKYNQAIDILQALVAQHPDATLARTALQHAYDGLTAQQH